MSPNWFIGFPVSPGNWYETVITNLPTGIKSFEPVDLHITFAFLGPVEEEIAHKTWNEAKRYPLHAFEIKLGPLQPFGNPARPSAFSFTLAKGKDRAISYLQLYRDKLRAIAGIGPDPYRVPRPHITVARPPRNASEALQATGLAWAKKLTPPDVSLTIDRIALYTWSDDRTKQQFKAVDQSMLL